MAWLYCLCVSVVMLWEFHTTPLNNSLIYYTKIATCKIQRVLLRTKYYASQIYPQIILFQKLHKNILLSSILKHLSFL